MKNQLITDTQTYANQTDPLYMKYYCGHADCAIGTFSFQLNNTKHTQGQQK